MRRAAAACLALALAAAPVRVHAQGVTPHWYFLSVTTANDSGPFTPAGVREFARARVMAAWRVGPVGFDYALETTLALASAAGAGGVALGQSGGGDWMKLDDTLARGARSVWRVRADRAVVSLHAGRFEATAGRQPISWATTLLFTPADPFAPFDPADPFREFRAGVDALRVQAYPGAFSDVDLVLRPATYGTETVVSALARGKVAVGRVQLSAWGGALEDEAAGAVGFDVTAGGAVLRTEAVVRRAQGRTVARLAAGADRSFEVAGRTLYALVEYQYDGLAATGAAGLPALLFSRAFARGTLQVLGRHEVAAQATYQLRPLWSVEGGLFWNATDGSALLAPAVSYATTTSLSLRAGLFVGLGAGASATGLPRSEYGLVPTTVYLAATLFP